ncbi:MAG: DUF4271 domain-containing protein [Muribaculaceae bacterium]|nr:DUF4271 domain-containing protein [Muribaculaceae bacterium]
MTPAADSAATAAQHPTFAPVPWGKSVETMAPTAKADSLAYAAQPRSWAEGIAPVPRHTSPADNTGVLSIILAMLVLIAFNIGHIRRLFKSLPQKLLSVRRRDNAFDERTANETRTMALLTLQLCVMEALLLYLWLGNTTGHVFATVGWLTALTSGYYIFQLCAYSVVGHTFADRTATQAWRQGLNASSALLGIALTLPALIGLFYAKWLPMTLTVAAALYIAARIAFIAKGFRIFYKNLPSVLYFILYLCTLEIIPVIAVCEIARLICRQA